MTGLSVGQRVIVSLPRGNKVRGVILEVYEKSYKVGFLSGASARYSAAKVTPDGFRMPTAKLEPPKQAPAAVVAVLDMARAGLLPVPKPELPEECPAWLAFVRKQPCCSCGTRQNIEAHHEGKKGVSQKVRDTLAVPLCLVCHSVYTQKNRLPIDSSAKVFDEKNLRTREVSLEILRNAQELLLQRAVSQLEQRDRIEILSKGLAKVRGLAQLLGRITEAARCER